MVFIFFGFFFRFLGGGQVAILEVLAKDAENWGISFYSNAE